MYRLLLLSIILFASCKSNDSALLSEIESLSQELKAAKLELAEAKADETGFIHTVYFWLKKDITVAEKADFIENGLGELKNCKHLSALYFGPPAMTDRSVVDNSYDYAWICHFKDKAAQDAYQIDPLHTAFVSEYEDLFDRVIVYDNLLM